MTPARTILSGTAFYSYLGSAMTLAHNTLVLIEVQDGNGPSDVGIWISADGTVSSAFPVSNTGDLQFKLGGGLLQHTSPGWAVWNDLATSPGATPAWLMSRSQAPSIFPIHEGAGYAVFGSCNGLDLVATSGKSCGCLAVPGLTELSTIGRDGSLIIPGDHYELYPGLLH